MKILKDDFLFGRTYVGVYLGSGKGAVAEDGLDVFDVYAFFQKEGGEGVAKCVRGDGFEDAGFQGQFFDHDSYRLGREVAPQAVDEEERVLSGRGKTEALVFVQGFQNDVLAYLDDALLAPFAIDFDEAVMEVYGRKAQSA